MRDYVLLVFVIGLVPLILYRAWIGALAWTWIGLMNPHLYTWELRSFPFAQVIGVAFLVGWVFARDKRMFPLTPGIIGMCFLLAFVTLKNPFAWNQDVGLEHMESVLQGHGRRTAHFHVDLYAATGALVSLGSSCSQLGSFSACGAGSSRSGQEATYKVQGPEPSFIGGNTHIGVALLMVAPMFVAFMRDTNRRWLRLGAAAGVWLTLLATLFTYSRGAWLGLGAVATLLFLQSRRKALLLAIIIPIGLVGVAMVPEKLFERMDTIAEYKEDLSALQRLQSWGVATNVALAHPLGSGFTLDATPVEIWMTYANFHRPEFNRSNAAHSIYFQMLGDHGFGGLALFLIAVIGTFWTLARVRVSVRGRPELEPAWPLCKRPDDRTDWILRLRGVRKSRLLRSFLHVCHPRRNPVARGLVQPPCCEFSNRHCKRRNESLRTPSQRTLQHEDSRTLRTRSLPADRWRESADLQLRETPFRSP